MRQKAQQQRCLHLQKGVQKILQDQIQLLETNRMNSKVLYSCPLPSYLPTFLLSYFLTLPLFLFCLTSSFLLDSIIYS